MKIDVRVKTGSSRSGLTKNADGTYTAFLRSAPVEGAANGELTELLSDEFDIAKSSVKIIKGAHSKSKVISICQK